jgi:hypothetical protein
VTGHHPARERASGGWHSHGVSTHTSPEPDPREAQASGRASNDAPDDSEGAASAHEENATSGAQVSEAGGASLNEETSEGGADAVPDAHG